MRIPTSTTLRRAPGALHAVAPGVVTASENKFYMADVCMSRYRLI